jgi:excinuclease ABC subunit C
MLELDSGLEFDAARDEEFFAALPAHPGVVLLEMTDASAQPYLARTADIRRAAERLLRVPEGASKRLNLRAVVARIRYRVTGSKFEQTFALYQNAREKLPQRYRDLLRLRRPALLKVNLRNDYPRCYVTRGLRADDAFYFGPFASRRVADGFAEGFLDLFKTRRCQIKIRRDPNYPGCIYSEMKMCLAPCFAGCTKQEYDVEVGRVLETLESTGASLKEQLGREREAASETLDFERAAAIHKRLEKVSAALWGLPEIARRIEKIDAVILQRAAEEKSIAIFPVRGGLLAEPIFVNFGEASQPRSVEAFLRHQLDPDAADLKAKAEAQSTEPASPDASSGEQPEIAAQSSEAAKPSELNLAPDPSQWRERYGLRSAPAELSEHLSMIARWFYSKPREGEIFFRDKDWPYRRILRACSRLLQPAAPEAAPGNSPPSTAE